MEKVKKNAQVAQKTRKAAAAMLCLLSLFLFLLSSRGEDAVPTATTVNENGPLLALTFDDGPYPKVTTHILDVLEKHGVCATFFVLGSRVEGREEVLLRMEALGCEIGNHTFSHADLTRLSAEQCKEEIDKTNAEFERALGHPASVVRPPYGFYNAAVRKNVPYPLVLWTVDTNDWRPRNVAELADAVVREAEDGCVILMHDQQSSTAEAMDAIIPALVAKGFRFVTVSELIAATDGACKAVKMPGGG